MKDSRLKVFLAAAETLARKAHEEQVRRPDKDGNRFPYINHVQNVVGIVETVEEKIVAWLHDVLEVANDSSEVKSERDLLEMGFPDFIVEAVVLLTHDPNQPGFPTSYFCRSVCRCTERCSFMICWRQCF